MSKWHKLTTASEQEQLLQGFYDQLDNKNFLGNNFEDKDDDFQLDSFDSELKLIVNNLSSNVILMDLDDKVNDKNVIFDNVNGVAADKSWLKIGLIPARYVELIKP